MPSSLLVLAFATAMQTPPGAPDNCRDDNGVDRCDAAVQTATRGKLGLASIEDEAGAGAEIYRALFVDGYGKDMPAVSFERRPGQVPIAVVYAAGDRRISAPVSADVWQAVQRESVLADRELVTPDANPAAGAICLHSWVQTVEMANSRPTRWRAVPVRRRTEDTCNSGLTTRFAFFLAETALKAIPPCDVLDEKHQRNHITQLATCAGLLGDRLAAASLRNERLRIAPREGADPTDSYAWQAALGTNGSPRLDWGGEVVQTRRGRDRTVAEFLTARVSDHPGLRFEQHEFEGVSSAEARSRGVAVYEKDGVRQTAPFRQTWVWDPNLSEWMLSDWVVERFASVQ